MNKKPHPSKWVLTCELSNLSVNQRKEAIVLLDILNTNRNKKDAFHQLKTDWLNVIHPLPPTDNKKMYNTVTSVRYQTLKRLKELCANHMVLS